MNYHRTCDRRPPPGLSQCEMAKWQYKQALSCQRKRQEWEERWGTPESAAPHKRALDAVKQRLKRAAEAIKMYCPPDDTPPMCSWLNVECCYDYLRSDQTM